MNDHYDYIIIGSGAGGSAAAYHLARTGKRVLLLEKGGILPTDGSTLDLDKVIRQGFFKNQEPWLDRNGRTVVPEEYFNLGGKTKWYGAALLRYSPEEFEADEAHQCLDWPIAYRDLEPYYEQVEKLLGVRQFEMEPNLRVITERLRTGGWQAQPLPLGLAPEILDYPQEAMRYDGFASLKGLKADAQRALLERVQPLPNLTIMTQTAVQALLPAPSGPRRIEGVVDQHGRRFQADHVLLAAGALHSPRLLQDYMEATGLDKSLPNYRMVGRQYKHHLLTALLAVSSVRITDVLRKTLVFLNARFPHSSVQPLGFGTDVISTLFPRLVPRWTAMLIGARAYGFFLQTEDGSHEGNRVLARANGVQRPQLDYDPRRLPSAVLEHKALIRGLSRALLGVRFISLVKPIALAGTAHACGTLITGNDPRTSVVDAGGQVHGLENLHVVDGSILPRSSRVNPSLTIYSWALRVAERLEPEVRR